MVHLSEKGIASSANISHTKKGSKEHTCAPGGVHVHETALRFHADDDDEVPEEAPLRSPNGLVENATRALDTH
jgi:hypothetical protein